MEMTPRAPSAKGSSDLFTGDVWMDVIAFGEHPSRVRMNLVRFAPGARTAWHSHVNGQTLHVVDGQGLVQARGGQVLEVRQGDTVHAPPGEWHWHGAAAEHFMSHLAIWEGRPAGDDGPESDWAAHVTDAEYRGLTGPTATA